MMSKKILLILLILLFAVHTAWGLIRIGRIGTNGGLNVGQGGIGFYKSAGTVSPVSSIYTHIDTGGIAFKDTGGIAFKDY